MLSSPLPRAKAHSHALWTQHRASPPGMQMGPVSLRTLPWDCSGDTVTARVPGSCVSQNSHHNHIRVPEGSPLGQSTAGECHLISPEGTRMGL